MLEEVGCGKTTLTRAFILQLKEDKYDAGVVTCTLNPLSAEGSIQCVAFRLENAGDTRGIFTEEAVRLIYQYTRGIARSINNLCDLCLLEGYTARAWTVDAAPVRRVAQERR